MEVLYVYPAFMNRIAAVAAVFRCETDKPSCEHALRIWESSALAASRLRDEGPVCGWG